MGVIGSIYCFQSCCSVASSQSPKPNSQARDKSSVFGKAACHLQNTRGCSRDRLGPVIASQRLPPTQGTGGNRGSQWRNVGSALVVYLKLSWTSTVDVAPVGRMQWKEWRR